MSRTGAVGSLADQAIWRSAERGALGVLSARYVRQSFPRHWHDSFVICVNERGAHGSWYAGRTVTIPERSITVVPPGEVHTGHPVPGQPWHYRAIYPSAEWIATLAAEVGFGGALPAFSALWMNDEELADAFVRAHRRFETDSDPLAMEGPMEEVLMTLLARHGRGAKRRRDLPPSSGMVNRAIEYIAEHHADRITLAMLAQVAGVSRYAILRAFRRHVGLSPYSLVTQMRVEHAQRLLQGGVPIAAVSQRVGFTDQSHLNRHFKRLVGVTPGVYARAARAA